MWKVKSDHGGGANGEEHDGMAKMENGEMGVMGEGGGAEKGKLQKTGTNGWSPPLYSRELKSVNQNQRDWKK